MTTTGQNPYVGARTFRPEESHLFFGREREAFDLLSLVISDRLVLFYAQSGAGKSSLILTRLIPGLIKEKEFKIFPVGRLRRDEVTGGAAKNLYIYNLLSSLSPQQADENIFEQLSLSDYLTHLDFTETSGYLYDEKSEGNIFTRRDAASYKYVLIIDQFEELFTTHEERWQSRADFFHQLSAAMKEFPRLWVVLVMREDYVAYLDPYIQLLPGNLRTRFYMQRLGHQAAIQAVEGPAAKQNRPFALGVAERLINDLSGIKVRTPDNKLQVQPGQFVEPVQLQVVCSSLWEKLPSDVKQIAQEHLDQYVGDVDQALGNYYEERVRTVAEAEVAKRNGVKERDIREWFGGNLITADGIRNMVARERDGESGGLDDEIVQEFVKRGDLVRAENRGGATFYELTHDRLVEPILENNTKWLADHSSLLQQQTALWIQQGRTNGMLLRGRALRNARKEIETREPTEDEKAFLGASHVAERNRTVTWIATGIALISLAILSLMAFQASSEAQIQRDRAVTAQVEEAMARQIAVTAQVREAEQRQLAEQNEIEAKAQRSAARAQIYQTRPGELYTSTLLAIDSFRRMPSDEAEDILRRNISLLPLPIAQFAQAGKINAIEVSPQGDAFVTASVDGTACAWKIEEESVMQVFCSPSDQAAVNAVAFSPDGSFLITGDLAGIIRVFDASTGNVLRAFQRVGSTSDPVRIEEITDVEDTFTRLNIPIRGISIRPTREQQIAVAYDDGHIPVFDPSSGKISTQIWITSRPNVSGLSPNGNWLVTGSEIGRVTVWNLGNGGNFSPSTHRGGVLAMGFAPRENKVATAGVDTVSITNLSTERELFRIPIQSPIRDIAFSPDDSWFVAGFDDHRIRVWDALFGNEQLSMSQDGSVTEVAVSSDGQWIATTGSDRTARVWNAETGAEIFQIPLKARGARLVFFNNDKWLITTDQSGAIAIWDISVMTLPAHYISFDDIVANVQYSPSGDWLAVSAADKIWLLTPDQESILREPALGQPTHDFNSNVVELAFSPDSKVLGILTENEVAIYKIEGGIVHEVPVSERIQSIAFTPDSQQLMTSDLNGNLEAWNINNQEQLILEVKGSTLTGSARVLAVGSQDKITLLREDSNSALRTIQFSGDNALMSFSADGSLLASASSSGEITIFQYQAGQFTKLTSFIKGQVTSLAFHPGGTLLAVGTSKNVFLVDIASGTEAARISHPDIVNDLAFSLDGTILVTASSAVLQFWELSDIRQLRSADLIATACSYLYENLSPFQWEILFGDEPYQPLCEDLPGPG